jgi:hypothetical protein
MATPSREANRAGGTLPPSAQTFVSTGLSSLFIQRRLYSEVPCPHADNDRIAAIRTNQALPRGNYINHIAAEALARSVRSKPV